MNDRVLRTYQGLIMAGLGFFMLTKIWDGTILFYIHQRLIFLPVLAGIGLIILAQVTIDHRKNLSHSHAPGGTAIFWLALPLLIGILFPARGLKSESVQLKGVQSSAPLVQPGQGQTLPISSTNRSILDWIRLFESSTEPEQYRGEMAQVIGFVYHDPELPSDSFYVIRFAITCCVVDASALGMVVSSSDAEQLADDQWIQVTGKIVPYVQNGKTIPMIAADTIKSIDIPQQPYLFP